MTLKRRAKLQDKSEWYSPRIDKGYDIYKATTHRPCQPTAQPPASESAQKPTRTTVQPTIKVINRSEELAGDSPPLGPLGVGGTLRVDGVPVDLATARVDVDLRKSLPGRTLPDPADEVEEQHDEDGEVGLEEALGVERVDGGVELENIVSDGAGRKFIMTKAYLSDEDDDDQAQSDPGSGHAEDGGEGDLVNGVAMVLPGVPEADVGEADATPGEEGGKTGERLQPVESDGAAGGQGHEGQGRPHDDEQGGVKRTAGAVDVGEESRCVTLLGKRAECAGATVDTGETDGDDGKHDDDVGEVGEADDTGSLGDDDEWRGLHIDVAAVSEKSLVVVVDEETDEGEGQDVEEGDTPEDLLDRRGKRLARVLGFGCSETDKLGSREGEGCSHEHSAEADESGERAGILPPLSTLVFGEAVIVVSNRPIMSNMGRAGLLSVGGTATADKDDTHEQEDDNCGELQQ
jgi:hypothetical protein